MSEGVKPDLTTLTVQLLSAYVGNNAVPSGDLAELIRTTRATLAEDVNPEVVANPEPEHTPAVSIRASLASRDHILSMIDGKPYKSLKRHLSTHGLTPQEYRIRYNLPADYPMVAPSYSEQRREVAKKLGLGRKKGTAGGAVPARASTESVATAESPRKTRGAKTSPARASTSNTSSGRRPTAKAKASKDTGQTKD